jgi:hypothetical protein
MLTFYQRLPDLLFDELNRHVYNGSNASTVTLSEILSNQKDKHETLRRTRRRMSRIIHNTSLNNLTITDDLNVDPESDSHFFMTMIIEALDKLGKLADVQSRLIQGLRFELRSLMDAHISQFVRSLETSGTAYIDYQLMLYRSRNSLDYHSKPKQ